MGDMRRQNVIQTKSYCGQLNKQPNSSQYTSKDLLFSKVYRPTALFLKAIMVRQSIEK